MIAQTNAELAEGARSWLASDRSPQADARYLERLRSAYEHALPRWPRWQRRFRTLIEDHLGMSPREIAWTNLAKCPVSIDRGSRVRAAERELTRLCQRAFPTAQLVEAIRPAAVLVAVLAGREGGDIVATWRSPSCSPLVWSWQGQSGHDRHNTAPWARRLAEWASEMAAAVRRPAGETAGRARARRWSPTRHTPRRVEHGTRR